MSYGQTTIPGAGSHANGLLAPLELCADSVEELWSRFAVVNVMVYVCAGAGTEWTHCTGIIKPPLQPY